MTDKNETQLDNFYYSLNRLDRIIDDLELEREIIRKCFELALDEELKRREKNIMNNNCCVGVHAVENDICIYCKKDFRIKK